MLYKIKNNLVDIAPEQCLTGGDYKTRGGEQKYKIISAKNNIYKFSFSPRTIMTWNYLPVTVAIAPDLWWVYVTSRPWPHSSSGYKAELETSSAIALAWRLER
jgi:hypothetical protein